MNITIGDMAEALGEIRKEKGLFYNPEEIEIYYLAYFNKESKILSLRNSQQNNAREQLCCISPTKVHDATSADKCSPNLNNRSKDE